MQSVPEYIHVHSVSGFIVNAAGYSLKTGYEYMTILMQIRMILQLSVRNSITNLTKLTFRA
jgi:hypothetical protein